MEQKGRRLLEAISTTAQITMDSFESTYPIETTSTMEDSMLVSGMNTTSNISGPINISLTEEVYDYELMFFEECGYEDSGDVLHLLLKPHVMAQCILAFLGLVANLAGICSLMQHRRKNQRDCTRARALLLISLSVSDMATSIAVPLRTFVIFAMQENQLHCRAPLTYFCTTTFLDILTPACQTITLLNLLGMAIDHWITFIKPFRYFEIMTKRRVLIMIACFWIFSLLAAFCEYLTGLKHVNNEGFSPRHYCFLAWEDKSYHPDYILLMIAPFCLVAMIIIYVSISKEINKLVVSAPPRQQDFGQAKRALRMTYFILLTFLICWLPCFGVTLSLTVGGLLAKNNLIKQFIPDLKTLRTVMLVHQWLFSLLLLNSILDPIIYMSHFRMRLSSLCHNVMNKVFSYSLVEQTERATENGPSQSHTISTIRSSVQYSAGCNGLASEPLVSSGC